MYKELTFDQLTGMVGSIVLSSDDNGHSIGEYVVEEFDKDHGWIAVSRRKDNKETTLWPEDISVWHFRLPGTENKTSEGRCCPLKTVVCSRRCAWFNEDNGMCAVFKT